MGFPFLPQPSAAAELFVVHLVAQHDPQPDPQLAGCRDSRLAHPFLHELALWSSYRTLIEPSRKRRFAAGFRMSPPQWKTIVGP